MTTTATRSADPTADPAAAAPGEGVRGFLAADRLCTPCRYNLHGAAIVQEERYGLSIVRCPQCGQVAAVEEYPPLSRWVNRWAMLAAAVWLLFLIALGLGSVFFTSGMTMATAVEATDSYEGHLRDEFRAWRDATYPDETEQSFWVDQARFTEFWDLHEARVTAAHPPFSSASIEWDEMAILLVPASAALVLGVLWSILLITRGRWIIGAVSWAILVAVVALLGLLWLWAGSRPMVSTDQVAMVALRFPIMLAALPLIGVVFTVGLLLGRPIARGLVRALLPPRLRGPLAILWTAEGRTVPTRSVEP